MAYIKTLKDNELIGGTDNIDVYPVTTTQGIFRQNPDGSVPKSAHGHRLEEGLQYIEKNLFSGIMSIELDSDAMEVVIGYSSTATAVDEIFFVSQSTGELILDYERN